MIAYNEKALCISTKGRNKSFLYLVYIVMQKRVVISDLCLAFVIS